MFTFEHNGMNGFGGQLGTLVSNQGTAELQRYLASIGKLGQVHVTGQMNPQTFAVIYDLLVQSAATVGKIPLLPLTIRDGITKVTNALKAADDKIKSVSYNVASLPKLIGNLTSILAIIRAIPSYGPSAANATQAAYDAIANAVAGASSTILAAVKIFFPPMTPAGTSPAQTNAALQALVSQPSQFYAKPSTTPSSQTYPPGTIYAWSPKLNLYRIAVPKSTGGLGAHGLADGLAAPGTMDEVAPSNAVPPGGTLTTEPDLERRVGKPLYKRWQFWLVVGGGVAVIGTGTVLYMRRKRGA